MTIKVQFLPDNIIINAEAGESLLTVAERAGIFIPTGCLTGSCHTCEVELEDGTPICACITAIPKHKDNLVINLSSDSIW
jgi:ferredoxin